MSDSRRARAAKREKRVSNHSDADRMHSWVAFLLVGPCLIAIGIVTLLSDGYPWFLVWGLLLTLLAGSLWWFVRDAFDLRPFLWRTSGDKTTWGRGSDRSFEFSRAGDVRLTLDGESWAVSWERLAIKRVIVRRASLRSFLTRGVSGAATVVFRGTFDGEPWVVQVPTRGCSDWRAEFLINVCLDTVGDRRTFADGSVLESVFGALSSSIPWLYRPYALWVRVNPGPARRLYSDEIVDLLGGSSKLGGHAGPAW